MGLATCIRRAGKALDGGDRAAIEEIQADYLKDGLSPAEAGQRAVEDHLKSLDDELASVIEQAKNAGADMSSVTGGVKPLEGRGTPRPKLVDPGPLRYRIEDEGHVDEEPEHPLSVMHKMAATVEDQANYNPGPVKKIIDDAKNLGVKAIPYVLGAIPRRYLGDFVNKSRMPTIAAHLRTASEMDGRRNALLTEDQELAKKWSKWTSKNKTAGAMMAELMHAATLAGVDPAEEYRPLKEPARMTKDDRIVDAKRRGDHEMLKDFWSRVPLEGQNIYREIRNNYQTRRKQVEAALIKRIEAAESGTAVRAAARAAARARGATKAEIEEAANKADPGYGGRLVEELRKQFEAGRVAGPYFPLMRFGDFWAVAKDKDTGEVVAYTKFEKAAEQKAWLDAMRGEFNVDGGRKQGNDAIARQVDPTFAANVTKLAAGIDKGLADDIWQMYLSRLPEMSMRKAFMHRKGRLGFSANAIRAFGHNMFHGAHQIAKLEYVHVMESQLETIYKEARAIEAEQSKSGEPDPDAQWASPLADELQKRFEWARNPSGSALASKLTSLGFVWYLGASVASAFTNLTQTPIVALPVVGAEFNTFGAGKELARAMLQWAGSRGDVANKLRGEERRAMEDADRIATFDKTMAADLAQLADGAQDYTSKTRKTAEMIAWMFQTAESGNRKATFLASFRLARMRGDSYEDSVALAHKLTYDSHFDYNNANRPRYMQGDIPKVLLLFRQYSLGMTYRLGRDFRDGVLRNPSISRAERNKAAQRFGGILGATFLMAGTTGLPLFWLAESVLNSMLGDDDDPFDTVAATRTHLVERFGEKTATAIMNGAWDALTGMTMSSRVSLNNLWVREAPENAEGEDLAMHYIGELAGPLPKMLVTDPLVAAKEFGDGYADRGAEKLMPKMAKDVYKTIRYLTQGVTNKRGDVLIPANEFTARDAFYQSIGFTPERVSRQYAENRAKMDMQTKILDRKTEIMDRLFHAAYVDDQKGIDDAVVMAQKFNASNPGKAIGAKNIISSAKSRAHYSRESVNGVSLDPDLRYLHEQIHYSDKPEQEAPAE